MGGGGEEKWKDSLEREHEKLQGAVEWMLSRTEIGKGQVERALQLCVSLVGFWEIRGHFREGRALLEQSLALSGRVISPIRGEALYGEGYMALLQGDYDQAEVLLQESLALFRELADKPGMTKSLRILGSLARARNTYRLARSLLEEVLVLSRCMGDRKGSDSAWEFLAQVYT